MSKPEPLTQREAVARQMVLDLACHLRLVVSTPAVLEDAGVRTSTRAFADEAVKWLASTGPIGGGIAAEQSEPMGRPS